MPHPSRSIGMIDESTKHRTKPETQGSFWFFIDGVSAPNHDLSHVFSSVGSDDPQLPSQDCWQDLKDLVRNRAENPGWAEVATFPTGDSRKCGWVTIRSRRDAEKLYGERLAFHWYVTTNASNEPDFLTSYTYKSCRLAVIYFDITRVPAVPLKSNTNSFARAPYHLNEMNTELSVANHAAQSLSLPATTHALSYLPIGAPVHALGATAVSFPVVVECPQIVTVMHPTYFTLQSSPTTSTMPSPVPYRIGRNGAPVNTSGGTHSTEIRGILVKNLNYSTTKGELEKFLRRAGPLLSCEIRTDPRTGKPSGNAVAKYATSKSAYEAIKLFDRKVFKDRCLEIKPDRNELVKPTDVPSLNEETTGSSSSQESLPQPLIVNGSHSVPLVSNSPSLPGSKH